MKQNIKDKLSQIRSCYSLDREIQENHKELYDFLKSHNIKAVDPNKNINGDPFTDYVKSNNDYLFYNDQYYMTITCDLGSIQHFLEVEFDN